MLFRRHDSANFWFQNRLNIEKKSSPGNEKSTKCCTVNLKGRIPLLFYCVKHIHEQFKTYLKYRNLKFTSNK